MTTVFVGTAGWALPRAVADRFPDGPNALARYAHLLNATEINSSFYRPHRPATYARWADTVPDTFRFAVKMPKTITHEKKLVGIAADLDRFVADTAMLGSKHGPLLVQLPPSHAFDAAVVAAFFRDVRSLTKVRCVCEPRHPSWFGVEADHLLRSLGVARVGADPAPAPGAETCGGWAGLRYIRLHGSPRMYHSAYDRAALIRVAGEIGRAAVETWCVFDNTALGAAAADALTLRGLL